MVLITLPMQAKKVEVDQAEKLAQNFIQSKRQQLRAGTTVTLDLKYIASNKNAMLKSTIGAAQMNTQDTTYYYVFNVDKANKGGFVIVSGDDVVKPVLGYSDHGSYDETNLPPNFAWWMDEMQRQIAYAQSKNLPQSDGVKKEWESYLNGTVSSSTNAAAPLIQTHWDQFSPYNNLCPAIGGTPAPTGCVATAMAQIMKFWNYPASGSGNSEAYTTQSGISLPSVSYEINYDWTNMQNDYTGSETQQQQDAVATLMYHCGLSVQMQYDAGESSAVNQNVYSALINNFGYDANMKVLNRNGYSDTDWENLLRTQIDAGMPVYYAGEGSLGNHAFVCDGYDDSGNFHFNWGWSGAYDGYFVTNALYPGGYEFNLNQMAITDIKPVQGGLKGINVSSGILSPTFRPFVFNYTVQVDSTVETIDITGIAGIAGATVTGNVTALPLKVNDFTDDTINVSLPNGDNQTYKVSVIRGTLPDPSFTWTVDSAGQQINIFAGVTPGDTLYIDWGDGTKPDRITENNGVTAISNFTEYLIYGNNIWHTYNDSGEYQVKFYGENEQTCPLLNLGQNIESIYNLYYPWGCWWPNTNAHINQIDVRKALLLRVLFVGLGEIPNMDVSYNTDLEELYCTSANLSTLDVSNNSKLLLLFCDANNLTNLDVSNNTALRYLECIGNQLTKLDISHNSNLSFLECTSNQLTNVDVSYNTALLTLSCQGNQLSQLDLSHNIALTYLYCDQNKLTNLDVSKNINLNYLYCYSNHLPNLDITKNMALKILQCDGNALPLNNLYTLAQRTDITTKQLGNQTLPDSTIVINTPIAVDTVFYGVNTTCNYPLNNGKLSFSTPGDYWVQLSNPAILDGQVQQTFHVVNQGTGINAVSPENPITAWSQNGMLHVSGLTEGKAWRVYDVSGKLVYQSIATGEKANIPLFAGGVYLVQSGGKTVKVIIE